MRAERPNDGGIIEKPWPKIRKLRPGKKKIERALISAYGCGQGLSAWRDFQPVNLHC
jgi:hypothetical protein